MRSRAIEALGAEHAWLRDSLRVLEGVRRRIEHGEEVPDEDVRDLLDFLRHFDESHQIKEEAILFPALLRAGILKYGESVKGTLFEHAQGRSLIEALTDAHECKDLESFGEYAGHLIRLMDEHLDREDAVLFAAAEKLLTPEQDQGIVTDFEAADEETGEARRHFIETIERLIRTYGRDADAAGQQ